MLKKIYLNTFAPIAFIASSLIWRIDYLGLQISSNDNFSVYKYNLSILNWKPKQNVKRLITKQKLVPFVKFHCYLLSDLCIKSMVGQLHAVAQCRIIIDVVARSPRLRINYSMEMNKTYARRRNKLNFAMNYLL